MKISTKISKTVREEIEIDLPIWGSWRDDCGDGRVTWETRFFINENLELRTITETISCNSASKWQFEFCRLSPDDVGSYIRHNSITKEDWELWAKETRLFI